MSAETLPFNHLVAIYNPTKSRDHFDDVVKSLMLVRRLPLIVVESEPKPLDTAEKLALVLKENSDPGEGNTLILPHGGDGTLNSILEPALEYDATVVPSGAGTANDFAVAMNGGRYNNLAHTPADILDMAIRGIITPVDIRLIEMMINGELENHDDRAGIEHRLLAANYASFGLTAKASLELNSEELRMAHGLLKKDIGEVLTVLQAAKDSRPMGLSTRDGKPDRSILDLAFMHGSRVAKRGKPPTDHTQNEILVSEMKSMATFLNQPRVIGKFVMLMYQKVPGSYGTDGMHFELTGEQDEKGQKIYCQVDGEDRTFLSPLDVYVGPTEQTLPVLSAAHGMV